VRILTHNLNKTYDIACYDAASDTVQFSQSIINELNMGCNFNLELLYVYGNEMEKINSGDLSNIAMVKMDEAIGSIGVGGVITQTKEIINGLC